VKKSRRRHVLIALAATLGLLVAALFIASLALDSYVHRHEHEVLAQLETRLGRKVDVGRLSASLWTGLTAENVTIGGSSLPGDQAPLFTAERVRVRASLMRTLLTLGRRVQVADIRLSRPTVNVVRLADGSLNVDHVVDHVSSTGPVAEPAQPMSARTRRIIENARLGQARITDGRVRFVDRLAAGHAAVEVTGIDLTLADVGIKRRPSVQLRAAVLAAQPNLELRAQLDEAGSLERLPPPLESARLTLGRTDLGPLMPLVARVVSGLEAGVASADLAIRWTDVAEVKGGAQLNRARFAGGVPFDAKLDVDVSADAHKRDLDVRRLELAIGEMSLVAKGKLQSLATRPRFEGFSVESRKVDFDGLRRLYPPLDRRLGATVRGPVQLRASASAQEFTALIDLTAASVAAPGRFEKPRGTPWRVSASGRAQNDVVELASLTLEAAQQTVRGRGTVRLGDKHPALDLHASTDAFPIAALTPFVPSLAAARLPPLVVSADAHLTGRAGVPASMALEVERLAIASRKSDLSGTARVRDFARPQIELSMRSSYLDTADLLPSPTTPARAQPAAKRGGGPPPTALAHLGGHAALTATRGLASGIPFDGLKVDLAMRDGTVHANTLDVGAWGGRVSADGSDFDVAREAFHLTGRGSAVDVEQLLASVGGAKKVLRGRLSAKLDVRGAGTTPAELERSLAGTLDGTVEGSQLLAFNLDELLAGQLIHALPFPIPTQRLANLNNLGTLRGQLRFADGAIILDRPLTATTPEGPLELAGRFFFDGRLDLTGTLQLNPAAASALFANRIRVSEPLPLALRLTGDIHRPTLGIPNLVDVGKVLVRGAVGGLIPGRQQAKVPSREKLQQDAVDQLKGLLHP
jgi:AsmA protein